MNDRRARADRRRRPLVPEPLERAAQRRGEERRDSLRRPVPVALVSDGQRCLGSASLSLAGATVTTVRPPAADAVELRAWLAGDRTEFVTRARVVQRLTHGTRTTLRLVFEEPPVTAELALARWLDTRAPSPR